MSLWVPCKSMNRGWIDQISSLLSKILDLKFQLEEEADHPTIEVLLEVVEVEASSIAMKEDK